ncbi:hypothetical protein BJY21_003249 [Kineosphaera limosa]|uniref:Uncharacterized protein n=1 Tax=Kineosphaera limosa NBRC 100340 TaxID=1184609 RepID=K6W829_9MICO|nr:hypothetical protein [Kineosphaera limosa]NYE02065.1 hypothetical protein [Kineosphaera limosa]GAB95330.1 hypothetical protein KILIM_018_00790 [Kineosphaera limosa NBRC 100340]
MVSIQDVAKEAKAAEELIATVSRILATAARSAVIEITNATSRPIKMSRQAHEHGAFARESLPTQEIAAMSSVVVGSRSSEGAVATGTEGRLWYTLDDEGTHFYMRWNVPFISTSNEQNYYVAGPHKDLYDSWGIISGGNKKVAVKFVVTEKATLGPFDFDWVTCTDCKGLFHKLRPGKCPARVDTSTSRPVVVGTDGTTIGEPRYLGHRAAGHTLGVPFGQPGPNRSTEWRKCRRCSQLFWDGGETKGACPKWSKPRLAHVGEENGREYLLPFDVPPRSSQQDDWRFCEKCHVLFYFPHGEDGGCAAGGKHRAFTRNYVLMRGQ